MLLSTLSNDLEVSTKSLLIKCMADARLGWAVNNYHQALHSSGMNWITIVIFIWLLLVLALLWGSQKCATSVRFKGPADVVSLTRVFELSGALLTYWAHHPTAHNCTTSLVLLSGLAVLAESVFPLKFHSLLLLGAHSSKMSFKRRKCNVFCLMNRKWNPTYSTGDGAMASKDQSLL